jgi:hypothetical protein
MCSDEAQMAWNKHHTIPSTPMIKNKPLKKHLINDPIPER